MDFTNSTVEVSRAKQRGFVTCSENMKIASGAKFKVYMLKSG